MRQYPIRSFFPDTQTATICSLGHVHCSWGPTTLHFRSVNDFAAFADSLAGTASEDFDAVEMAVGYLPLDLTPQQANRFALLLTLAQIQGDAGALWNWLWQYELTRG